MRTAWILLVLGVVLGFVEEAGAETVRAYTIPVCEYRGDSNITLDCGGYHGRPDGRMVSSVWLGPFGTIDDVPFTAIQGLIGFCLILAVVVVAASFLVVGRVMRGPGLGRRGGILRGGWVAILWLGEADLADGSSRCSEKPGEPG